MKKEVQRRLGVIVFFFVVSTVFLIGATVAFAAEKPAVSERKAREAAENLIERVALANESDPGSPGTVVSWDGATRKIAGALQQI